MALRRRTIPSFAQFHPVEYGAWYPVATCRGKSPKHGYGEQAPKKTPTSNSLVKAGNPRHSSHHFETRGIAQKNRIHSRKLTLTSLPNYNLDAIRTVSKTVKHGLPRQAGRDREITQEFQRVDHGAVPYHWFCCIFAVLVGKALWHEWVSESLWSSCMESNTLQKTLWLETTPIS